ncbi:MAG: CotH kinase family protein [Ruminococcus sp.]|nr:CotH kinase family protein [Ruminococcus sp.]
MRKNINRLLAILLVVLSLMGAVITALPVFAADGYKAGDVIYVDYSSMPQWYTGQANTGFGVVESMLYVNFTANTRYDSGEKETVVIGNDTARFDPRLVTDKLKDCVYKYVVTEEDAGAQTLRFWRGSAENLWNHSVELTYADYLNGYNTVVITDYNHEAEGSGSIEVSEFYDYELEAEFSVTAMPGADTPTYGVALTYKDAIDADVRYAYEIYVNDELYSTEDTCEITTDDVYTVLKGVITAYYNGSDKVAAKAVVTDSIMIGGTRFNGARENNLYAHAVVDGAVDMDAWMMAEKVGSTYYFFLPSGASDAQVELYSTHSAPVTIGQFTINPGEVKVFDYSLDTTYSVSGAAKYNLKFMHSGAEAALFVNNDGSVDGDLWDYLTADKSNEASAYAAIVNADGTVENTDLKKIKGRGNTTWAADKKPFNVNFKSTVTVGDMQPTKKYSLLANFQDAAMARNRVLYDLGDAVELPYSCDSRFVDFYVDGVYVGQYQMTQKIDPGSDNLITDMDEEGHLNDDGSLKEDFSMLIEIPAAEDFYTDTNSGIPVCIKNPELEKDDPYYNEVKSYAKTKFDQMCNALKNNSANMSDYLDIDSFAKAYLIQEVGKNWDTHSWYLCYMPDESGNYKFFASPVWDFDNSIGNANGVRSDLEGMRVNDYTKYSGWWCKYKSGNQNFTYFCTQNDTIMDAAKTIWFKKFVPAINVFAGQGSADTEILSQDLYFDALDESADMNYMKWELLTNTGWVADHSQITKATFDYETLTYKVDSSATRYDQYTFDGQFDYMTDWLTSRAAWISNEWKDYYVEGDKVPETPKDEPPFDPSIQPTLPDNTISAWVFNSTGKTVGEKLTEYGDKSGYVATTGEGMLVASVNSDGYRALEWSAAEYGTGAEVVPLVTAGSKNPWGDDPYVQVTLSTAGYENIAISLTSAGSKKCPASWQLAYSFDGETFTDVEGASYTIALNDRKQPIVYFDDLALPAEVANKDSVILRLYAVSDVTVSGGSTADDPTGGELVINNIIITGDEITAEPVVYIVGDADCSGLVNVKDATTIQKHVASLETGTFSAYAADANENGDINVKDATEIQKHLAMLTTDSTVGQTRTVYVE